uniref:TIMELESS domain-containing protein n=1 Tax=Strongyloides venezuelensis TaxID=75913 RepID=A0A0K0G415_STRVS
MDAEIIQLINQLGVYSEGQYKLHPFYKASLYQIKRHLAVDNDKVILLKCSEVNIVGNDLIPIMKILHIDSEKKDLFLMCLKICITLMEPSNIIFEHMDQKSPETITLISTREGYLSNILRSIANSDIMIYLNNFLVTFTNEEEKSDISIAIKENIFHLLQLVVSTNLKCMTSDETNLVEGALISKMIGSNIIETIYKYSKSSGYKSDMYMFIHIFGEILKGVDPSSVVKAEVIKRKKEERLERLPVAVDIKELVKSIEGDLEPKRTKPLPDDKDPLFPLVEEVDRKKHSQRRRIVMSGRFPGTFVDMTSFTKSGRARIVNKIEGNTMDSIVKQNNFKTFQRSSNMVPVKEGERSLSLMDKTYTKIYDLIKMLTLSGFDFQRYAYSDIVSWCDLKADLTGVEVNYLHLQWFMLKISRLDNVPWLFQYDFMTFENIEIWTERVIGEMNKYEKPKINFVREKCKYIINILKEVLYRIPNLKERNENQYRSLIYDLYFHSYLKSFIKIYQYMDKHLSSEQFCVSLFSLTSVYFRMAKFINENGGYCGHVEKNDALEVKNELIEVYDLMGQFYSKFVARCIINFILTFNERITPTVLHNLITVIYYSSFGLRKMIFFFEVRFFVCLRKWIYVTKKESGNSQMLTVLENFQKRLMIHIEEYHIFGVGDSTFLKQISKPVKTRKKKTKKRDLENEEDFEEKENEEHPNESEDGEHFYNSENEEKVLEEEEKDVGEILKKKISRVVIEDTSDIEEVDDVMEKLDSQHNEDADENHDTSRFLSDEEDQSDDSKESDSDEEYRDKPNEIKPEDLFLIYNKKRSLFEESDDEDNEEMEASSQRPSKRRKTIEDDDDE